MQRVKDWGVVIVVSAFLLCSLLMLLGAVSTPASASKSTEHTRADQTFGDIEYMHERNLSLQAELKAAELERSITETRATSSTSESGRVIHLRSQVISITGSGKALQASVRLVDGRVVTLSKGSLIPDTSLRVVSLGASGVGLSDGSLITF